MIGSILPWIEAILLHLGAKKVTTLEYAEVNNEHPKLNPITPEQLWYGNLGFRVFKWGRGYKILKVFAFPSQFSRSKSSESFLIFFIDEYQFCSTFFVIDIF